MGDRAHRVYRQDQSTEEMTAIPRNKYSFTVSLDTIDNKHIDLTRIANIQMPSFTYRTQTINKYNNKSIVQTGIDYTPITLTAYDTKDATFEKFLKDYARYYVTGPMNDEDFASWLVTDDQKGLNLQPSNHYISKMTITRVDAKSLSNVIEIFHPFIQNADADTLDYSDSSPTQFRVAFSYEGYRILSDIAPPPPVKEVSNQPNLETSNTTPLFTDESNIHPVHEVSNQPNLETSNNTTPVVTSNKAELVPIDLDGPGNRPSNVRGISRPTNKAERDVRKEEIAAVIREGNVVADNYPYESNSNVQLVKYRGKTYMSTTGPS
jgi:hypothetical protein